jgi:hypothetical protein
MTRDEQNGQLACIDQVNRSLVDLERSVVITGVGLTEYSEFYHWLNKLKARTQRAPVKPISPASAQRTRPAAPRTRAPANQPDGHSPAPSLPARGAAHPRAGLRRAGAASAAQAGQFQEPAL